jgi:hypothetical protein
VSQLQAFGLTQLVELGVAAAFGLWLARRDEGPALWRLLLIAALASLLTHPLAWATNQGLAPYLRFAGRAAIIELVVVVAETFVYRLGAPRRWPRALFLAAAANGLSFTVGLLVYAWIRR